MKINSLAAALILAATVLPGLARADVLQIDAGSSRWIAGGPTIRASAGSSPEANPVDASLLEDSEAPQATDAILTHPASFTEIAPHAGPARFQEHVAQLAAKYDISPTLLEAVVWQESRWNVAAQSPAGALGLAQLMPGTARQMGVNPFDPLANLEGGARYLRMQLDAFGGDVERALAAYNAGPGRVAKAGGIPAIRETQLYVASILARLSEPVRK